VIAEPAHDRRGLVNLVAELERRLRGEAPTPGLDPSLAGRIPEGASYVVVLYDGLGDDQLSHPALASLAGWRAGVLEAPFPTTTTVSLATVASGLHPAGHGVIGHLMWLPELQQVVNVLKWVDLGGGPVSYPTVDLLPAPNLWERLTNSGRRAVTIQPGNFAGTPTTAALYRGCDFVGVDSVAGFVDATVEAASVPGSLVFAYWPPIDFAAHVWGQASPQYETALREAGEIWHELVGRLPEEVVMVGTADHGMVEISEAGKVLIRDQAYRPLDFHGDPRGVMVRGSLRLARRLAAETAARLVERDEAAGWLGPGNHPRLAERLPDALLLAPAGQVLLPPGFDKRLVGYHGGLSPEELAIPLLVATG
jgi:hypothetical protein